MAKKTERRGRCRIGFERPLRIAWPPWRRSGFDPGRSRWRGGALLHGRYLWFTDHNDKAGEYLLKATQLQPDYALAWIGVANYWGAGALEGQMSPRDSLPRAEAAARRTASLDDSLPEVHVTLGNLAFFADWNWQRAQQEWSSSGATADMIFCIPTNATARSLRRWVFPHS